MTNPFNLYHEIIVKLKFKPLQQTKNNGNIFFMNE